MREDTNQVRRDARLKKCVADTEKLGFLTVSHTYPGEEGRTQYEVRRILKARIDNDRLEEFQRQLSEHLAGPPATD